MSLRCQSTDPIIRASCSICPVEPVVHQRQSNIGKKQAQRSNFFVTVWHALTREGAQKCSTVRLSELVDAEALFKRWQLREHARVWLHAKASHGEVVAVEPLWLAFANRSAFLQGWRCSKLRDEILLRRASPQATGACNVI